MLLIYLLRMYFANSGDLQAHLNDDWSVFLRNLKTREEMLHELLQYNHHVIRQRLQEDELFTNDQILNHHARIAAVTQANSKIDREQAPLMEKYEATVVGWQDVAKLMQRVGARVLETLQLSLEQCKALDQQLVEKHTRVKQALIRLLNQRDHIDLEAIAKLIVNFSRTNLMAEVDRLKKIVEALENGELSKLREVYDYRARRASLQVVEKQKVLSVEKSKNSSLGREDRSPIREQIRKQEKVKKQKQKVAAKLVHGLYSMLDLSRQQFVEDICGTQHGKAVRLYNQIFSRNRFNHMQILAFQAKKDEFLEKVRLFKEMMERQSNRIALNLTQRPPAKRKQKEQSLVEAETASAQAQSEIMIQDPPRQEPASQRKKSNNRYRIQSPKQKREIRQFLNSFSSVMQGPQENFNHFRFDSSGQEVYARTNRNRLPLPQINPNGTSRNFNRASSLDQRVQLNKTKIAYRAEDVINEEAAGQGKQEKEEKYLAQRARYVVKNVDIGGDSRRVGKEGKRIQNYEPHPMEYTFYVRKNSKQLNDFKLNALL